MMANSEVVSAIKMFENLCLRNNCIAWVWYTRVLEEAPAHIMSIGSQKVHKVLVRQFESSIK